MSKRHTGQIVRVAYHAELAERDHVDVRIASGEIVSCYRCEVDEVPHPGDVNSNMRFLQLQAQIQAENQRFVTLSEYMRERATTPKGVR